MSEREEALKEFLSGSGWGAAERSVLAGDASSRRYERLAGERDKAVLMDAPPAAEAPPCPSGASVEERRALGYNALACLAGPDSGPFVAIADWLLSLGLSAPRILAADLDQGFLILEDLGDALFTEAIAEGVSETKLYQGALDALVTLHSAETPPALPVPGRSPYELKPYDAAALQVETDLLIDWYIPLVTGEEISKDLRSSYKAIWCDLTNNMKGQKPVLVLRDYHAQNLLWLPERDGVGRIGQLDFQDAVLGHPAYDVVSLLEDARRDVDPSFANEMLCYYISKMKAQDPSFDEAQFRLAYALLGAQRNAKIVGIFARLWLRDKKPVYLEYLPRVWGYLEQDLMHPDLSHLKDWFDKNIGKDVRKIVPKIESGS